MHATPRIQTGPELQRFDVRRCSVILRELQRQQLAAVRPMGALRVAVAYHEAGHACVAWRLGFWVGRARVSAEDGNVNGNALNRRLTHQGPARTQWEQQFLLRKMRIEAAGPIAEERSGGAVSWVSRASHRRAVRDLAARLWPGMDDDAVQSVAAEQWRYTETMVREIWPAVQAVAAVLLRDGVIAGRTITALCHQATGIVTPAQPGFATDPAHA